MSLTPSAATMGQAGWVRIDLASPIRAADVAALRDAGVEALQYAPHDGYLVYAKLTSQEAVRRLSRVRAVQALPAAAKLDARLRSTMPPLVPVQVLTAASAAPGTVAHMRQVGVVTGRFDLRGDGLITLLSGVVGDHAITGLAARPEVLQVALAPTRPTALDEGSAQILARNLDGNQPQPGYDAFLDDLGIDGSGVTMSVVDDGIDFTHPEFDGQIKARFSYGPLDRVMPSDGHGAHVAGIVGGHGAALGPVGTARDDDGLAYGMGVAPGVMLVDQPALVVPIYVSGPSGQLTPFPPDDGFRGYVEDAMSVDAVGWNASWTDGGGTGAGYTANAASLDALTRDGDAAAEGQQPFTFVFAAGNSGQGSNPFDTQITSPAEAKNVIAVASSRGHRAGDVDQVSDFSSRGPARDGRIVPVVTAPGETIISARAATGVLCTMPLSGLADAPPADGFTLYTGCSGTSMAAPHVTGAVALITDWWREHHDGADPSPAMIRALLVNSAVDMGTPDIPNRHEGWGRVDLRALFDPAAVRVMHDQDTVVTDTGQVVEADVTVVDADQSLRVTLAWTDPPGMPSEQDPVLVNDLDLVVTGPDGTTWLGNVFADGWSVAGGSADRINNLENVYLDAAQAGTYRIQVQAAKLPGDAITGDTNPVDQDYALAVTNAD